MYLNEMEELVVDYYYYLCQDFDNSLEVVLKTK